MLWVELVTRGLDGREQRLPGLFVVDVECDRFLGRQRRRANEAQENARVRKIADNGVNFAGGGGCQPGAGE